MSESSKLIRCRDHRYAPWSVVCVHLLEGTAAEWVGVPQPEGGEAEFDWLCPACAEKDERDLPLDELKAVCIHCVRELKLAAERRRPDRGG